MSVGTRPTWLADALAVTWEQHGVEVDGATIRYLAAGSGPLLVFVHGGTAHGHWWTPIAARFVGTHRVLVPDLSGHGRSDHRRMYAFEQWAAEIGSVVRAEGSSAVVVGHSIGGLTSLGLAAAQPPCVDALVLCDTLLLPPDGAPPAAERRPARPAPVYGSLAEARARFRTTPPQDHCDPHVLDHVVPHSLRREGDGWVWRFDRGILRQFDATTAHRVWPWLARTSTGIAYLRSEHGLVPPGLVAEFVARSPGFVHTVEVPGAGHHAMLDRPEELHDAVRDALPVLARP